MIFVIVNIKQKVMVLIHVLNYEIRRFGLTPRERGVETIEFGTPLASTNVRKLQSRIDWLVGDLLTQYDDIISPVALHEVVADGLYLARFKAKDDDDEALYELRVSIQSPRRV